MRPLQSQGAWMRVDCSDFRQKPPLAITGWPVLRAVAGHIVKGHLLVITIDTVCPATPASQVIHISWIRHFVFDGKMNFSSNLILFSNLFLFLLACCKTFLLLVFYCKGDIMFIPPTINFPF